MTELTRRDFITQLLGRFLESDARDTERTIISKSREIIEKENPNNYLEYPYIASTCFYSNAYLENLGNTPASKLRPNEIIILGISKFLTPQKKIMFAKTLNELLRPITQKSILRQPLNDYQLGQGENHHDALDIFTHEGNTVYSISDGIPILSEASWTSSDPMSTTTDNGGNTVIIFCPGNLMIRYAHLKNVSTKAGNVVKAGEAIGTVGNTGRQASMPGHGNHLHLEINQISTNGEVTALNFKQITNFLKQTKKKN